MKILFVTTISNTINAFLIPHIKLLINQGHRVDIACNIEREISKELIQLGCRIYNIPFQRSPINKKNLKAYKEIKSLILKGKYSLIHTHTPIASFLTRISCRNIPNLKILYTAHGFHFYKDAPLKNWIIYYPMEKFAAKWTDAIITINKEDYNIAKKIKFLEGEDCVHYIPGVGIDLYKFIINENQDRLKNTIGLKNSDFILFYAAELNENKNQNLLIESVKVLKGRGIDIKLLLAGKGPLLNKYKEKVKNLDLENNIYFLGYREDVPNLLKISDIAVASSKREGLPVNIIEAMAAGLPIVVTNCRGHRDLIINNENGFVVEIDDVQGYVEAIEILYRSKKLREKFGEINLKKAQLYSLENVLLGLDKIYKKYTLK